jgi:hypothetical protein
LDDEREPVDSDWIVVRSVAEAKAECLRVGLSALTEISLDHDLGEGGTGKEFVNWLICADNGGKIGKLPKNIRFRIHTQNPPGRDNIAGTLKGYFLRIRGVHVKLT